MRTVIREIPVERLWDLYDFDPFKGKLISRTTGKPVKGFPNRLGYLRMTVWHDGRPIQRPYGRVVWAWLTGAWPIHEIDHINRDKTDHKPWNLRDVTCRVNQQNRSNFAGAYWNKEHRHWRAQIRIDGQPVYLGKFKTKEEAQAAYWSACARFAGACGKAESVERSDLAGLAGPGLEHCIS